LGILSASHSKLIPNLRTIDTIALPSEISADEWGEVTKFSRVLDEEFRVKERESYK
jgi:hypothetical protein